MAMIDLEYRFSKEKLPDKDIRRKTTADMEEYLRNLVFEMQSADISSKYIAKEIEGERNMIYVNGKSVIEILVGLKIVMEPDEETCGCHGKPLTVGRPMLEWDENIIEDIPDILVKNAISKTYCDIQKDRIM